MWFKKTDIKLNYWLKSFLDKQSKKRKITKYKFLYDDFQVFFDKKTRKFKYKNDLVIYERNFILEVNEFLYFKLKNKKNLKYLNTIYFEQNLPEKYFLYKYLIKAVFFSGFWVMEWFSHNIFIKFFFEKQFKILFIYSFFLQKNLIRSKELNIFYDSFFNKILLKKLMYLKFFFFNMNIEIKMLSLVYLWEKNFILKKNLYFNLKKEFFSMLKSKQKLEILKDFFFKIDGVKIYIIEKNKWVKNSDLLKLEDLTFLNKLTLKKLYDYWYEYIFLLRKNVHYVKLLNMLYNKLLWLIEIKLLIKKKLKFNKLTINYIKNINKSFFFNNNLNYKFFNLLNKFTLKKKNKILLKTLKKKDLITFKQNKFLSNLVNKIKKSNSSLITKELFPKVDYYKPERDVLKKKEDLYLDALFIFFFDNIWKNKYEISDIYMEKVIKFFKLKEIESILSAKVRLRFYRLFKFLILNFFLLNKYCKIDWDFYSNEENLKKQGYLKNYDKNIMRTGTFEKRLKHIIKYLWIFSFFFFYKRFLETEVDFDYLQNIKKRKKFFFNFIKIKFFKNYFLSLFFDNKKKQIGIETEFDDYIVTQFLNVVIKNWYSYFWNLFFRKYKINLKILEKKFLKLLKTDLFFLYKFVNSKYFSYIYNLYLISDYDFFTLKDKKDILFEKIVLLKNMKNLLNIDKKKKHIKNFLYFNLSNKISTDFRIKKKKWKKKKMKKYYIFSHKYLLSLHLFFLKKNSNYLNIKEILDINGKGGNFIRFAQKNIPLNWIIPFYTFFLYKAYIEKKEGIPFSLTLKPLDLDYDHVVDYFTATNARGRDWDELFVRKLIYNLVNYILIYQKSVMYHNKKINIKKSKLYKKNFKNLIKKSFFTINIKKKSFNFKFFSFFFFFIHFNTKRIFYYNKKVLIKKKNSWKYKKMHNYALRLLNIQSKRLYLKDFLKKKVLLNKFFILKYLMEKNEINDILIFFYQIKLKNKEEIFEEISNFFKKTLIIDLIDYYSNVNFDINIKKQFEIDLYFMYIYKQKEYLKFILKKNEIIKLSNFFIEFFDWKNINWNLLDDVSIFNKKWDNKKESFIKNFKENNENWEEKINQIFKVKKDSEMLQEYHFEKLEKEDQLVFFNYIDWLNKKESLMENCEKIFLYKQIFIDDIITNFLDRINLNFPILFFFFKKKKLNILFFFFKVLKANWNYFTIQDLSNEIIMKKIKEKNLELEYLEYKYLKFSQFFSKILKKKSTRTLYKKFLKRKRLRVKKSLKYVFKINLSYYIRKKKKVLDLEKDFDILSNKVLKNNLQILKKDFLKKIANMYFFNLNENNNKIYYDLYFFFTLDFFLKAFDKLFYNNFFFDFLSFLKKDLKVNLLSSNIMKNNIQNLNFKFFNYIYKYKQKKRLINFYIKDRKKADDSVYFELCLKCEFLKLKKNKVIDIIDVFSKKLCNLCGSICLIYKNKRVKQPNYIKDVFKENFFNKSKKMIIRASLYYHKELRFLLNIQKKDINPNIEYFFVLKKTPWSYVVYGDIIKGYFVKGRFFFFEQKNFFYLFPYGENKQLDYLFEYSPFFFQLKNFYKKFDYIFLPYFFKEFFAKKKEKEKYKQHKNFYKKKIKKWKFLTKSEKKEIKKDHQNFLFTQIGTIFKKKRKKNLKDVRLKKNLEDLERDNKEHLKQLKENLKKNKKYDIWNIEEGNDNIDINKLSKEEREEYIFGKKDKQTINSFLMLDEDYEKNYENYVNQVVFGNLDKYEDPFLLDDDEEDFLEEDDIHSDEDSIHKKITDYWKKKEKRKKKENERKKRKLDKKKKDYLSYYQLKKMSPDAEDFDVSKGKFFFNEDDFNDYLEYLRVVKRGINKRKRKLNVFSNKKKK